MRSRLNILHTTPYITLPGGVSTVARSLARAQALSDHRVAIQCGDDVSRLNDGYQVIGSPFSGPWHLGYSPAAERWAGSSAGAEFDVVHQHGLWQMFSRVTNRWRERHARPTVVAPHGTLEPWALQRSRWKKSLALRGYERENLQRASCLQATAPEEVAGLRRFGLTNPVAIIPNGVSLEWAESAGNGPAFRAAHGIPESGRLLLFLSRMHPKKGLLELIDAFGAARDSLRGWDLVVAGPEDGPQYVASIRSAVARHNLGDRVHFVGVVRGREKRDLLSAVELLVLPTFSDNFAIVIAEALAVGVPVLTTREAIAWPVLEERGCGWRIGTGVAELADGLRHACTLPADALSEIGHRGIDIVRGQYLWSHAAERSLEVYRWVLGEISRPDFVIV